MGDQESAEQRPDPYARARDQEEPGSHSGGESRARERVIPGTASAGEGYTEGGTADNDPLAGIETSGEDLDEVAASGEDDVPAAGPVHESHAGARSAADRDGGDGGDGEGAGPGEDAGQGQDTGQGQ